MPRFGPPSVRERLTTWREHRKCISVSQGNWKQKKLLGLYHTLKLIHVLSKSCNIGYKLSSCDLEPKILATFTQQACFLFGLLNNSGSLATCFASRYFRGSLFSVHADSLSQQFQFSVTSLFFFSQLFCFIVGQ